jgi:hypothetical protein
MLRSIRLQANFRTSGFGGMLTNQVLPAWEIALELGKLNEQVIDHEFAYQGIPLIRTPAGTGVVGY